MTKATIDRAVVELMNLATDYGYAMTDNKYCYSAAATMKEHDSRVALEGTLRAALSQPPQQVAGVPVERDAIAVNLMRFAGLDKHKARECAEIVQQVYAAPQPPVSEPESIKCVVTDNEHPNGIPYEQWVTHPSAAMKPLSDEQKRILFECLDDSSSWGALEYFMEGFKRSSRSRHYGSTAGGEVMGEYANDQIRADIKRMTGFDPGPQDDDPPRFKKPVYKRVRCPYCDKHPKEAGLSQHIRDVHAIGQQGSKP